MGYLTQKRLRWLALGAGVTLIALAACWPIFRRSGQHLRGDSSTRAPVLVPKAMTIAPGIHMLGELEPSVAYVVESSDGLILIDSGVDGDAGRLKSQMSELGLDWRRIRAILITHVHGDHSGGAERIRAETGAKVFAGAGDADVLRAGGPREAMLSIFYRPSYVAHPTTIDVELRGEEAIDFGDVHFRALGTPGHTPGSICYLMERHGLRVLFAGDVILMLRGDEKPTSQVRKAVGIYSAYLAPGYRGDAEAYLSTLLALRRLQVPDLVLPGHPCTSRTPASPQLSQARWESMLDEAINDLRILLNRFAKDGRDFLDGEPKEILHDLYYLGEFHDMSVYGFSVSSKFFLVDAPGGPGLLAWVRGRLKQLGAHPGDPVAVLLTSCDAESIAGLKDVISQSGASVVASSTGIEVIRKQCGPGTVAIAAEDLPGKGWFPVRVVPLRGRGVAPVAYAVNLQGKTALFSGRIPIQSKVEREEQLIREISRSRATAIDYLIAVNHLASLEPDLWLPAFSAYSQNANLYDAEWRDVIELNYRLGYYAALGLGLLAPRPSASTSARGPMDDDSVRLAREFTGSPAAAASLRGLHEEIGLRGRVGLATLQAQAENIRRWQARADELLPPIALLEIHEGRFREAARSLRGAIESENPGDVHGSERAGLALLIGIAAVRQAEREPGAADDLLQAAAEKLNSVLEKQSDDLRARWLVDVVQMKLARDDIKVPQSHSGGVQTERSPSNNEAIRFEDAAKAAGLLASGPRRMARRPAMQGDFNGDGLPDLLITSLDTDRGASLYLNAGNGKFTDASEPARLGDQVAAIRACAADFDNDGDLDVVLVRGAGEMPMRLSLLRNDGKGVFEDVTSRSGLAEPIAAASASWGDFDRDGFVDFYVCGEYLTDSSDPGIVLLDPRNRSRLYRNQRDGTFQNIAVAAGVAGEHRAVDSTWGDYDGDGLVDLFVSSWDGPCRLYHNRGDGRFDEVAAERGVAGQAGHHASACFFWDFDNDGQLDILVGDGDATIADLMDHQMGRKPRRDCHPRLYRNVGSAGFKDVSREVGLDWPIPSLAANFGDIDNDGFLDVYFGGGLSSEMAPAPNVLLWNRQGKRFEDVTEKSGTRRLRTGHSVSFADWNGDGSLDLVVTSGGASPGSREDHLLFQNHGPARRWLAIKLVGTKSNRGALGAKIHVELTDAGGTHRSIERTIGSASSSGGNLPVEMIGLGDAVKVERLVVTWPVSQLTQEFRDIAAGQMIEVKEGGASFRVMANPSR